jgi:hypothetical protein
VAVDSETTVQADAAPGPQRRLPEHPFAISAASCDCLTIERLVVFRDVYYLSGPGGAEQTWELADNELFLAGDYSPHSIDSRDPSIGPIKATEIMGTAVGQLNHDPVASDRRDGLGPLTLPDRWVFR